LGPAVGFPCIYIVVLLITLPLFGRWVLGPFTEAVRALRAPSRFFMSDFIWLLVLLQASFAAARLVPRDQGGSFGIILTYLVLASVAIWGGAVSALSRAGVLQTLSRGVFVLVLLPTVLVLMVGVAAELGALTGLAIALLTSELELEPAMYLAPLGVPAIVAAGWTLRQLTRWVVAGIPSSGVSEKDQELETQRQISPPAQAPTWDPKQEGVAGDNPFSESFSGNKD